MLDNDNNNNINNWLLWLWSFWYQILAVLLPIRSFLVTRYSVTYVDIVAILTELMFGCVLFHAIWPDLQWQLTFLINPNIIEIKRLLFPGLGQTQACKFFLSNDVTRVLKMELFQLKNFERTCAHDITWWEEPVLYLKNLRACICPNPVKSKPSISITLINPVTVLKL